jgi:tRNA A-37 threonylcarbamoyl transferase component Bud32/membrane-associated phospholipid phosphatase
MARPSLTDETARATIGPRVAAPGKRRRRPSGEPPPLPRQLHRSGRYWLALACITSIAWLLIFTVGESIAAFFTRTDVALLQGLEELRAAWLTPLMRGLHVLGSDATIRVLRWVILLVLLAFKRFRHLFVFLGCIILVGWLVTTINLVITRPRPLGIDIIGSWEGFANPSEPVARLAVTLVSLVYSLVVSGHPRSIAKWIIGVVIGALCVARLYLGVDHPTDVIGGVVLGVAIPLVAFRLITPNEVFPVTYRRGRTAHLDIGGRRGDAIRRALEEQLGVTVAAMKPFNLEGSGGSTPMRLTLADQLDTHLFAKLYAANHLRADRWYKLGRTLLYGRLEDERSFSTVRRLVQYEDYLLRVMHDAGLNVPRPYGFIEITPEREYIIVTEFVEGGQELLEAEIDEEVIDHALRTVRSMWDAGIAHRDIKPSNILVREKEIWLIDVAFGEVRPSPWRQAVDLANMMLVLGFRSNAKIVYECALAHFTPDEIAEAFAATHSVTMPSQSRDVMKKQRPGLLEEFRLLAPRREPISIQTWSWRRLALSAGVLSGALLLTVVGVSNLRGVGLL